MYHVPSATPVGDTARMDDVVPAIPTARLELVSMSLPFMRACVAGDLEGATRDLGAAVPATFPDGLGDFFRFRIADLTEDPSIRPWLGRVLVLPGDGRTDGRQAIGSVGFHRPPGADGRVEIGYHVEPAFRGQGYATEAASGLLDWARREHGIRRFRAATAPDNAISQRILARLGFRETGRQWDEIDEELVFELDDSAPDRWVITH
jgi:RimJ/RimL family protein N-acetyltransferase